MPEAELSTQATNVANAQLLEEYFEELNLFDFPPDAPSVEAGKEATIELSVTAPLHEAGEAGIEVSVTAPHEASEADAKPCLHVSPEIEEPAAQTAEDCRDYVFLLYAVAQATVCETGETIPETVPSSTAHEVEALGETCETCETVRAGETLREIGESPKAIDILDIPLEEMLAPDDMAPDDMIDMRPEEIQWLKRVRRMMAQEVGLPSLKMTPRSLAAALAVAPSDTSSRWTEAMLGIYRMTPPSPPAPSDDVCSEASNRPEKPRVHPVPALDFSMLHTDVDYMDPEDHETGYEYSTAVSHAKTSKTSIGSEHSEASRSQLTTAEPEKPDVFQAKSGPEVRSQAFMNKMRKKHLLPPVESPFAKPLVLAPIKPKAKVKKKHHDPQMFFEGGVPVVEQLHSHFHHHFHLRNDLPAISHTSF
ncbi:unnamed protein product [Effrenium voratum]|nr:unnamed protein product [Effrenium voratum]